MATQPTIVQPAALTFTQSVGNRWWSQDEKWIIEGRNSPSMPRDKRERGFDLLMQHPVSNFKHEIAYIGWFETRRAAESSARQLEAKRLTIQSALKIYGPNDPARNKRIKPQPFRR